MLFTAEEPAGQTDQAQYYGNYVRTEEAQNNHGPNKRFHRQFAGPLRKRHTITPTLTGSGCFKAGDQPLRSAKCLSTRSVKQYLKYNMNTGTMFMVTKPLIPTIAALRHC